MMGFNDVFTLSYRKVFKSQQKKNNFWFFSAKHLLLLIYWRLLKV